MYRSPRFFECDIQRILDHQHFFQLLTFVGFELTVAQH